MFKITGIRFGREIARLSAILHCHDIAFMVKDKLEIILLYDLYDTLPYLLEKNSPTFQLLAKKLNR